MKAVILTRVSTLDQEDGHSLAAQRARLEEYCRKKDMPVIKIFEIIESSTSGNRKQFHEMIDFIRRRKEKTAIVADAVDRVQRSFTEVPTLNNLIQENKTELHFLRESMIVSKDSSAHCELMWYFAVMGARSYALNIRDNVKRSQNHKGQNGGWCWQPPFGYKSAIDAATGKKGLAVDWERAPLIERLFHDYAIRGLSLQALVPVAKAIGLRTRTGHLLNKSHIESLLSG